MTGCVSRHFTGELPVIPINDSWQAVEKRRLRHCEERSSRRGNLELIDLSNREIASLRSQRRLKDFFN